MKSIDAIMMQVSVYQVVSPAKPMNASDSSPAVT
jgi:hypothetical protein